MNGCVKRCEQRQETIKRADAPAWGASRKFRAVVMGEGKEVMVVEEARVVMEEGSDAPAWAEGGGDGRAEKAAVYGEGAGAPARGAPRGCRANTHREVCSAVCRVHKGVTGGVSRDIRKLDAPAWEAPRGSRERRRREGS